MSNTLHGSSGTETPTTPSAEPIITGELQMEIRFPGNLRDWFAGQAIGNVLGLLWTQDNLLALEQKPVPPDEEFASRCAMSAYCFADAMLAARACKVCLRLNDDGYEEPRDNE